MMRRRSKFPHIDVMFCLPGSHTRKVQRCEARFPTTHLRSTEQLHTPSSTSSHGCPFCTRNACGPGNHLFLYGTTWLASSRSCARTGTNFRREYHDSARNKTSRAARATNSASSTGSRPINHAKQQLDEPWKTPQSFLNTCYARCVWNGERGTQR